MLLRYHQPPPSNGEPVTNFGDQLNAVLWPHLLGESFFDRDPSVAFLGIGSILGYPKGGDSAHRFKIIFGTGAAFSEAAQREPSDSRWRFYCVRGPLTARAYGLAESMAITDPAILVSKFYKRDERSSYRFGYMPHITEARAWEPMLRTSCADLGILYIDPRSEVDEIIAGIASVSVVIAEAMHAAIVADALRVPWIPLFTTRHPHRYKWTDWCGSLQMEYAPHWVGNWASLASRVRIRGPFVSYPAIVLFKRLMGRIMRAARPCLSSPEVHSSLLERFESRINDFRDDVATGLYS